MVRDRKTPVPHATEAAARVDSDLVARAYRKVMDRKALTQAERRALKRHETQKEEQLRWQYYGSIPQKHWRRMSGRQTKVINEQAARYGIPFGGPTIDLPKVVRAFHDFLADNALRLARDDDLLRGGSSPALERYRQERAELARLDRLERQRRLLPRDEVRQALGRIAAILRGAGDALQRKFGADAVEILYEALDDARREVERSMGEEPADQDAPDAT
ncbi:MAG: hypothetical protein ACE5I7_18130 [Candidatus Binatia bacterium]